MESLQRKESMALKPLTSHAEKINQEFVHTLQFGSEKKEKREGDMYIARTKMGVVLDFPLPLVSKNLSNGNPKACLHL